MLIVTGNYLHTGNRMIYLRRHICACSCIQADALFAEGKRCNEAGDFWSANAFTSSSTNLLTYELTDSLRTTTTYNLLLRSANEFFQHAFVAQPRASLLLSVANMQVR